MKKILFFIVACATGLTVASSWLTRLYINNTILEGYTPNSEYDQLLKERDLLNDRAWEAEHALKSIQDELEASRNESQSYLGQLTALQKDYVALQGQAFKYELQLSYVIDSLRDPENSARYCQFFNESERESFISAWESNHNKTLTPTMSDILIEETELFCAEEH
jgi:hypothetical protein